jgi:hypothetical protein
MTATIIRPVLTVTIDPVLRTLAEMDEQLALLRKRKVGAASVQSEAVESLYFLVKRARGEIRRMA